MGRSRKTSWCRKGAAEIKAYAEENEEKIWAYTVRAMLSGDCLTWWAGGGEWARTDREATANAQATGHVCWLSELSEGL